MVVPRARCVDLNIRSSAASQDHRQADGSSPDRACVQHEDFILRIASPSEGRGSALRCFPTPRILDVGRDRGNESTVSVWLRSLGVVGPKGDVNRRRR